MYLLQHVSNEFLLNYFVILFDQLYLRLPLNIFIHIIQSYLEEEVLKIIYIIV